MQGLEFSEGMLEKARKKTEDLKNVKLQQGDITDMPFPHEHFAGVTINQVSTSWPVFALLVICGLLYMSASDF